MKPALQFLELAVSDAYKMFETIKIRCDNEKNGRTNILDFCKKSVKKKNKKDKKKKDKKEINI
tara:strand:- start:350 stop:538 length:189 start_codon:yes stop_codon:yes gene_type:complete